MIRRGKTEGWLQLPHEAVLPWAMLNEVTFHHAVPGSVPGRGGALLAKQNLDAIDDDSRVLLTVPRDLILSLERVQQHAKTDKDFREVLDSLGDFGRTPRGAILSFVLVQASISCANLPERHGVHTPFIEYVKSLPLELLPTFWTLPELQLLVGTTLAPAMSAKLRSLRREYDDLCTSCENTRWYQIVQDHLDFDDWLQVDAMYRSRALDFPQIGHCMVPLIDLANHASGYDTIAIYEKDADGDAILFLRDEKKVQEGEEITITYGDEKGACEMLFSYGFLEESMDSAETLFLSLSIPDSDDMQACKMDIADCAPGFKLTVAQDGVVKWTGDFVWLLCVNEGDGLQFKIARTVDGQEEVQGFLGEQMLEGGANELLALLKESDLWEVYHLRAVTILQQRVFDQLQTLYSSQDEVGGVDHGPESDVRDAPFALALKLRALEFELMERAYEGLEKEKLELAEHPVVSRYLTEMNQEPHPRSDRLDEDFS